MSFEEEHGLGRKVKEKKRHVAKRMKVPQTTMEHLAILDKQGKLDNYRKGKGG